jgi:hypothetical protein
VVEDATSDNNSFQVSEPLDYGMTYHVEVTATDTYGLTSPATEGQIFVVNAPPAIISVNGIPVDAAGGPVRLEGEVEQPLSISVIANDTDVDPVDILTFSVDTTLFDIGPAGGNILWIPEVTQWGEHTFNVTVSDGLGGSDVAEITLDISTDNLAPVADAGEDFVVALGETGVLDGTGSYDPDGEIGSWEWTCISHTMELDDADGPDPSFPADFEEIYVFSLRVRDDHLMWCEEADVVTVTVNPTGFINDPPTLLDGAVSPEEGTVNDTYTFSVTYRDADGDRPVGDGYIRVVVDDTEYDMTALNDGANVTIASVFTLTMTGEELGVGSDHTYRFEAFDGLQMATGDVVEHLGPVVLDDAGNVSADGDGDDGGDGDGDGEEGGDETAGLAGDDSIQWAAIILLLIAIIAIVLLFLYIRGRAPRTMDADVESTPRIQVGPGITSVGRVGEQRPPEPPVGAMELGAAPAPLPALPPAPSGPGQGPGGTPPASGEEKAGGAEVTPVRPQAEGAETGKGSGDGSTTPTVQVADREAGLGPAGDQKASEWVDENKDLDVGEKDATAVDDDFFKF